MSYHVVNKRPEQHLVRMLREAGVCVRVIGWYGPISSYDDPIPIRQFILPDRRVYQTDVLTVPSQSPSGCEVWQTLRLAKPQRPL